MSRHARGRHTIQMESGCFSTDGDIWLSPTSPPVPSPPPIDGVDHVTLAPRQHMAENQKPGALYQSVMLMFQMVMNVHLGRANRGLPQLHGRHRRVQSHPRRPYNKIGGHEALRLEVADDMKLGLLVRRAQIPPANLVRCSPKSRRMRLGRHRPAASSAALEKTCGPAELQPPARHRPSPFSSAPSGSPGGRLFSFPLPPPSSPRSPACRF